MRLNLPQLLTEQPLPAVLSVCSPSCLATLSLQLLGRPQHPVALPVLPAERGPDCALGVHAFLCHLYPVTFPEQVSFLSPALRVHDSGHGISCWFE